ncbi:MAG: bifunctional DNA-formamidopyrimidine glycosylase/DNA-(apurinic or apyrimidinic site) lyase [Anaerolineae bacterium]|jgi:formamidopyrimidine-DNA glycosylase
MPELPEVETIARQLAHCMVGQQIVRSGVNWPRSVATHTPECFGELVQGRTIASVSRRAKFVVIELPPHWLIVHLRMTGRLLACDGADVSPEAEPHVQVWWRFASGEALKFVDVRKFGRVYLVPSPDVVLAGLGPEPLDDGLTPELWHELLQSRRRQIKPLLLDQRFLAGLGNIYVDEALWRAGIHPSTPADALDRPHTDRLLSAIRAVLCEAIASGGTTLRDYRNALDGTGAHGPHLAVYGRAGQPCLRCGHTIERLVVGSRGTHVCPICQPQWPPKEACVDS